MSLRKQIDVFKVLYHQLTGVKKHINDAKTCMYMLDDLFRKKKID